MKLPQLKVTCKLCPHECELSIGEVGKCLIRKGSDIAPFSEMDFLISTMAIEPLSKKPILHFIDDCDTLSLGSAGCSMSCSYCQNWKVSQMIPEKMKSFTSQEVVDLARQKNINVICLTYNEPTLFYPHFINLYSLLKDSGMNLVFKTNAYLNTKYWHETLENVDAMNIDFKGSEKRHMEMIGIKEGTYDVILDNMLTAIDDPRVHVEISIPVFEDYVNEDIDPLIEVLAQSANEVPLHLLRVFPVNRLKGRPTKKDKLEELRDKLSAYSDRIHIQNVYGK